MLLRYAALIKQQRLFPVVGTGKKTPFKINNHAHNR